MGYQPQVKNLLDLISGATFTGNQNENESMESIANNARQYVNKFLIQGLLGNSEDVGNVESVMIPVDDGEIKLRLYTPKGQGPFPVFVYFHGGGWISGNLELVDPILRHLTNETECLVVSVDYRLAPEFPFPVPAEDCYAATKWVAENISQYNGDPDHIVVSGDSAGGNLAAVVTLMAKDRKGPSIAYQVLIYPDTDLTLSAPSYKENEEGNGLTAKDVYVARNLYLQNKEHISNPYASPLLADDLSGLPPALIITCEYDVLRDEGEAYAAKLKEAGVPVKHSRYDGQIHGFFWMLGYMDDAKRATKEISNALKKEFNIGHH